MKNTGKSFATVAKVMTTKNCQQTTLNTPRIVFGDITKKHLPEVSFMASVLVVNKSRSVVYGDSIFFTYQPEWHQAWPDTS